MESSVEEFTVIKVNDVMGTLTDWQREAEIIKTEKNCIVHFEISTRKGPVQMFLRRDRGNGGHFWDYDFGEDYGTPESAMAALLSARSPITENIAQKLLLRAV